MDELFRSLSPAEAGWVLLALCTLGTLIWRVAAVVVARRVTPGGAAFQWIACVAYAMLAALIARIMVLPSGLLATTPAIDRLGAFSLGLVLFFLIGRKIVWGLMPAVLLFTALTYARHRGWL